MIDAYPVNTQGSQIDMTHRVSVGPYTLELPANGVAVLYQADEGGSEHQLPGGVGYLDALVQFAGEVIRLNAMLDQIEARRVEENRERYGVVQHDPM